MIVGLFMGLLLIGTGFLVESSPDLLHGYNMMSKEKKAAIDVAGLSAYSKKGYITIGVTIIVLSILFKIFHLISFFICLIMPFVLLAGLGIVGTRGQKYYGSAAARKSYRTQMTISLTVTSLLMGGILLPPFIPTKTIFEEDRVRFTGKYGFKLNISDIESVELVDTLPGIKARAGGVSVWYIAKGGYLLKPTGACTLLINSRTPLFLKITKNNGERFFINNKDKSVTEDTYRRIELLKAEKSSDDEL